MAPGESKLTMVLLCVSGSLIYWLPFISETYYVPMQDAFGFTKTQIGFLSSTFGLVSLITYFPGGWLADRVSPRKLISLALCGTAAGGFGFATIPSFTVCLLIYGFWGVTTACIFWSALIKATRHWATEAEQGRAFGILEGGRNASDMVFGAMLLALFAYRGGGDAALSEQILIYSVSTLLLAALVWIVMKDGETANDHTLEKEATMTSANITEVLKLPIVWLMATIIMSAYCGYWGATFFTPYATEAFDLGPVLGAAISNGKLWIAALAAVIAGVIADKVGPAKAVLGAFVLMTAGFGVFGLLPGSPDLVPLLVFNVAVIACAVYALRGIYFSLLEQGGIPIALTGTATGMISAIGYTPDIFMPVLGGMILDATPGAGGYQHLFLFVTALSSIGLVAAFFVYRKLQSHPSG